MPYLIDFHRQAEDEFILVAELYDANMEVPPDFPGDAIFIRRTSRAQISTLEDPSEANPCDWTHIVGYDDADLDAVSRWILEAIMKLPPELASDLVDGLMLDLAMNAVLFMSDSASGSAD